VALPLHPEFRTLPMVFYVPPLSPVRGVPNDGSRPDDASLLAPPESMRIPIRYLASMFAAGNEEVVSAALRTLVAVRARRRAATVGDVTAADAARLLAESGLGEREADELHRLTVMPTLRDRVVRPPAGREGETERLVQLQGRAGLAARVS
jgi:nitrate reductase beta subunit